MAKITAVRFSRTKNLGNFESMKAEIEIELEDEDTLPGVRTLARVLVAQELEEIDGHTVATKIQELVAHGAISSRSLSG